MRVFVAGATGVIGSRLVPLLVGAHHSVAGMTRSAGKVAPLRAAGAGPFVCSASDRDGIVAAMTPIGPNDGRQPQRRTRPRRPVLLDPASGGWMYRLIESLFQMEHNHRTPMIASVLVTGATSEGDPET